MSHEMITQQHLYNAQHNTNTIQLTHETSPPPYLNPQYPHIPPTEPFLRLPGSTVLPEAEKDMRKVADKNLRSKISANPTSPRFKDPNLPIDYSQNDNRSKMSDVERMRLNELGDELVKKKRREKNPGMALYQAANRKILR